MLKLNGVEITTEEYPNHETKVKDFAGLIQPDGNILEFGYHDDGDLVSLTFVKMRIDEANVPCTLFVWYMPYSRMDRKIEGDLFTLQYVCRLINWLNFQRVIVMEPHSEKTIQLLERAEDIYPAMQWLPQIMAENGFTDSDQIIFPDKGAAARYAGSETANLCVMAKKRDPITGKILEMKLVIGHVNPGAKCIIVDDLSSKGGTFVWAASILKAAGAGEIYLVVTHCEEAIFDGAVLAEDSPILRVYTSKSMMSREHPRITFMSVEAKDYA